VVVGVVDRRRELEDRVLDGGEGALALGAASDHRLARQPFAELVDPQLVDLVGEDAGLLCLFEVIGDVLEPVLDRVEPDQRLLGGEVAVDRL